MIRWTNKKPTRVGVYAWRKDSRAQKILSAIVLATDSETLTVEIKGTQLAGLLEAFPDTHYWSEEPIQEIYE